MSKKKSFKRLPCLSPWLADGSLNPYSLANTKASSRKGALQICSFVNVPLNMRNILQNLDTGVGSISLQPLFPKNLMEMPARRPLPRRTDVQARVWDLLCRHRGHFEWGWDGDERTGSWEPFLLKFFIANYYSVLVPPRPLSLELGAKWQGVLTKMSSLMLSLSL